MFISVLELFKIGIGPSSSHTVGPMVAAHDFVGRVREFLAQKPGAQAAQMAELRLRCTLKGSLAYTGKGHASERAVTLGLHGYLPDALVEEDIDALVTRLAEARQVELTENKTARFHSTHDIIFDLEAPLPEHPNGLVFELLDSQGATQFSKTYFSIGGGFISTRADVDDLVAPLEMQPSTPCPFPFESANEMLEMSIERGMAIADMKHANERSFISKTELNQGLDKIWQSMKRSVEQGLKAKGILPGGLNIPRRAQTLHDDLDENPEWANINDWLCAYAMAVNEENAAGHMVVTAPTNGAAGVIPSILYYLVTHKGVTDDQVRDFLLTAGTIGGLIKLGSSISGAEVGCQGEVGTASAMAAAGLCAVFGGTPDQVENAAEIALEHHLGLTCDPVNGLVQVPCIGRNGFGAIKAYTAASLAIRGSGHHFVSLDRCIAAMKQTGLEMSSKFKETSLGGLAVSMTEC